MSNEALTGFFGAYGSDDDDQSGSGDEGGEGSDLLHNARTCAGLQWK